MMRPIPMMARMGIQASGLSHSVQATASAPPSIPLSAVSHAVTAVPTFAPRMTLMAWPSSMVPELTKPTTMTVVADEDWMMAVTPRPKRKPLNLLEVRLPRMVLSLRPALFFSASPIRSIPKRNSARPHTRDKMSNKSIFSPFPFLFRFDFNCVPRRKSIAARVYPADFAFSRKLQFYITGEM